MRKEERWFDFSHAQLGYPTEPGDYMLPRGFSPDTVHLTQEMIDVWEASGFQGRIVVEQLGYTQETIEYVIVGLP